MIEQDTIRLLRECDAGVKMGVDSINEVMDYVHSDKLKQILADCKHDHVVLNDEIQSMLDEYGDGGKEPNPIAKGMSWMKPAGTPPLVSNPGEGRISTMEILVAGKSYGAVCQHIF